MLTVHWQVTKVCRLDSMVIKSYGKQSTIYTVLSCPKQEDHPTTCHDDGASFPRLHSETLVPKTPFRDPHSRTFILIPVIPCRCRALSVIPCRALPCALLVSFDSIRTPDSVKPWVRIVWCPIPFCQEVHKEVHGTK